MADIDVRTWAVEAFDRAAAAALANKDRPMEETLHRLAVDLRHPDTSDATLWAMRGAFAGTVEGGKLTK